MEEWKQTSGITIQCAKYVLHIMCKTGEDPLSIVEKNNLFVADAWTHIGHCFTACCDNMDLVDKVKLGDKKSIDPLVRIIAKMNDLTIDIPLIRYMIPIIIKSFF
jgi:Asp-tRNA(Asn)/Glu-tRNA(Gln) amidotransferase B subunit